MLKKYSYLIIIGLLTLHSLLLNGYFYGYGFNYIPFGYSLPAIFVRQDPTLYLKDMFVQSSIHRNTYFYDIVAWITRFIEIERFAFVLHIVALYITLLGIFYLATTLFKNRVIAYCAILLYALGLRQWSLGSPGIYVNFLNAGAVACPILIFSLNYFLKKQYYLSFFLAGLVFNIHALYSVNLCLIFLFYFIFNYRCLNPRFIFLSLLFVILPSLPSFFALSSVMGEANFGNEWLQAIRVTEWFHHFPSEWDIKNYLRFIIFSAFFLISIKVAPKDDKHSSLIIFIMAMVLLCLIGVFFTEVLPVPFIIRLHVWSGGTWIFYFIAIVYISHFLVSSWNDNLCKQFAIVGIMPITAGYIGPYWLLPLFLAIILIFNYKEKLKGVFKVLISFPILFLGYLLFENLIPQLGYDLIHIRQFCLVFLLSLILYLFFNKFIRGIIPAQRAKQIFLFTTIILLFFFDLGFLYKKGGYQINYRGYTERNMHPWVDIQLYARDHTPKDALFIVPPYLEGFTVFSKRSILGDWLVGATCIWGDNDYASEWLERMKMIGWENFEDKESWSDARRGYTTLSTDKFVEAAEKYDASYIVFEKVGNKRLNLPLVYENKQFILYLAEVRKNRQSKDLKDHLHYIINQKDGAKMVWVPEGEFMMGSDEGEDDEKPLHKVFLNGFYMDVYEVTNQNYCTFLNERGDSENRVKRWFDIDSEDCVIERKGNRFVTKKGYGRYPVVRVSWYGAQAYAEWAGKRLPTEAEWEYAARGGGLKGNLYPWGTIDPSDGTKANYNCQNDGYEGVSPVRSFSPNGYGLYDMAGNVWEWCSDWYNSNFYELSSHKNPWNIMLEETFRVRRGGSFASGLKSLRCAYRSYSYPRYIDKDLGFRCCQ